MWKDLSPYTNNTKCKQRPSKWACLPCYCQSEIVYRNKQLSYFVLKTDFTPLPPLQIQREHFLLTGKKNFPFKASFHHSKRYLKLKCPLPALFTWETGQKETWSSPPSNFSKLQPLILCKFIYSKQQHKQFFFLGSAAYWININHQRRRGWKEDGSPFSQRLIFFFFKAKTHRHKQEAIYHRKGSTWKSQLKTGHSQDCPGSLKSKRIFFYSCISLWWPVRVWLLHYLKPTWRTKNTGRGGSEGEGSGSMLVFIIMIF